MPLGPDVIWARPAGGTVSSVHVALTAAPVLPARSTMRTWKTCWPSARTAEVYGVVHAAHAPASMRHWNDSPDPLPVKAKVGVVSVSSADG